MPERGSSRRRWPRLVAWPVGEVLNSGHVKPVVATAGFGICTGSAHGYTQDQLAAALQEAGESYAGDRGAALLRLAFA
jgi:hypothetical protein